jgi:hypothetical protein
MSAAAMLARLFDLGVTPRADGDVLRLRPASAVPADLLAELRVHKKELLALLAANDSTAAPLSAASPEQAEAERWDRAAVAAEMRLSALGMRNAAEPDKARPISLPDTDKIEAELAALLAAVPGQRIIDSEKAAAYFAAEARRRLEQARRDGTAVGLLVGFWRHRAPVAAKVRR